MRALNHYRRCDNLGRSFKDMAKSIQAFLMEEEGIGVIEVASGKL